MAYLNTDDNELVTSLVKAFNFALGYRGAFKMDRGEWDGITPTTISRTEGRYCVKINNGQEDKIGLWGLVLKNRVVLAKNGSTRYKAPSLLDDDSRCLREVGRLPDGTWISPARLFDEDAKFLVDYFLNQNGENRKQG